METSDQDNFEHRMTMYAPSGGNRLLYRIAQIPTASDALPSVFYSVATSGKLSPVGFIAAYLVLVAVWLPFWIGSFLVTEWGVYAASVGVVFYAGRAVIRMIAFPGASTKVISEVETEFAKYSVRMLLAACSCLRDLSSAVLSTAGGAAADASGGGLERSPSSGSAGSAGSAARGGNFSSYEIPGLWKRAKSYRDRAMGVYLETLHYIYDPASHAMPPAHGPNSQRTRFGTNRIVGDIGNLSGLTPQAREDGRELARQLQLVLGLLDKLEEQASQVFHGTVGAKPNMITDEARATAQLLLNSSNELRDFVSGLKPPSGDDANNGGSDEDVTVDAMRRRVEEQSGSALDALKSGLSSILPMLDPPPHASIFGVDILRGTVLSRYSGAKQFWVRRPMGGMIDAMHIPANNRGPNMPRNPKAVMYCNPNAGLYEVATGMSLAGGNIGDDSDGAAQDNCWTDFYTDLGFDIYLFNYAGFGRSFGTTLCVPGKHADDVFIPGLVGRLRRICRASFLTFQPTPDTLREDGVAFANHIIHELGVESLVIHGESIGGVAASRTAQQLCLAPGTRDKLNLLICDRTFCNLEAVAQRLVGTWSGYAIRCLAPLWSTDVAGDFAAADCPKVVANDFQDAIIADTSSLKTGISLWRELQRGASATKGIGWVTEVPLQYRMADWENACVLDSQYVASRRRRTRAPVWPQDKFISVEEAFHFAACAKRIGRRAKEAVGMVRLNPDGLESGGDSLSPLKDAWETLACCDGLCGAPLGVAVTMGFDSVVAWLCACLTYGGQIVAATAERRLADENAGTPPTSGVCEVLPTDFDQRPEGYERQESGKMVHPKPIPEVLAILKSSLESRGDAFVSVKHEITFVIGMLDYIAARLMAPAIVQAAMNCIHLRREETMVGAFLNLHCGHNNPFSKTERQQLKSILQRACGLEP